MIFLAVSLKSTDQWFKPFRSISQLSISAVQSTGLPAHTAKVFKIRTKDIHIFHTHFTSAQHKEFLF